ncbi:MAG TPA: hypothetical protein VMT55_05990 [Candidatus Sulfotelmatobacter sp.]|nr:hypothetical protein [Candidatus Sulfotelmatobacter sp.]
MKPLRSCLLFFCVLTVLAGAAPAQTPAEVKINKEIARLRQEIAGLKGRLPKTRKKQLRTDILDKVDLDQIKIVKLKKQLVAAAAKPITGKIERGSNGAFPSQEAEEELVGSREVELTQKRYLSRFRPEIGSVGGFFAGATSILAEVRLPLRLIIGPATTKVRLASGLTQSRDTNYRFIPANLDLIFNLPPGVLTGVENYFGAGLNYLVSTSAGKAGGLGGEVFYGVQSEGFNGLLFGEIGYALMRPGFIPAHYGATILVGYRQVL